MDLLRSFERYRAAQDDRPLGDLEFVAGRTLQPFSTAGWQGAENLVDKARRALRDGDQDRARTLVDRAARLPFDDHEQAAPGALAFHMELFTVVTDSLEDSEEDDPRWLDAALAVLATADEPTRYELRDVLADLNNDYRLPSGERSRLRAAIAAIPARAQLKDLELSPAELADHGLAILIACNAYEAALEDSGRGRTA